MSSAAASPGMWSGGHGAAPPPEAHTPYLISVGLLGADTTTALPPSLPGLQPTATAAQQETLEAHPRHGAERSAPQSPLPGPAALAQQRGQQQVEALAPGQQQVEAVRPAPLSTLSPGISALSPGSSAQELIHSHELARAYATQASNPRPADKLSVSAATHTCAPRLGQATYPARRAARRSEGAAPGARLLCHSLLPIPAVRVALARCGTTDPYSTSTSPSSAAPTPCRTSTSSRSRFGLHGRNSHAHARIRPPMPPPPPALPPPSRLPHMSSRAATAAVSRADRLQRVDHRIALRLLLLRAAHAVREG